MADDTQGSAASGPSTPAPLTPPAERHRVPMPAPKKGGGIGGFIFWLRMLWYFIWNLPGFLNIMSAMQLRKSRTCLIRGYTKSIYLYPIIPSAAIMSLLYMLGLDESGMSSKFEFPLGVAFTLELFFIVVLVTEDVKGRNAVAAIAVLFGLAALYVGLMVAGIDVNAWAKRTFDFFQPRFNPGSAMLLAALCAVLVFWSFIRARFASSIQVQANQYITLEMHQKTPYPVEEWRLRARVSDWLERMWMGADDLFILSNWGTGRDSERDQGDAWDNRIQFTLHNVPGARVVEDLVYAAIAVQDVVSTREMDAKP